MGDILLKQVLGLAALLVFGGVLAALAAWLPKLANRWAGPPEPRGVGLADLAAAAERREATAQPSPLPVPPAREAAPGPSPAEDALLAAAVGLALALYQQEVEISGGQVTATARGASPWVLAGRWQTMQQRLSAQKR